MDPVVPLSAQVSALVNEIHAFTTREVAINKELALVASGSYSGEGSE